MHCYLKVPKKYMPHALTACSQVVLSLGSTTMSVVFMQLILLLAIHALSSHRPLLWQEV
jgi:hypothetical protein